MSKTIEDAAVCEESAAGVSRRGFLTGGDPLCVKRCPLGASQLSWEEYTVVRPGIDDYVEKSTEGALEGVTFTKEY